MERGQPSDANFDLCLPLLKAVDETNYITDNGVDVRNYPGGVLGLREAREMFCEQLGITAEQLIIGNNSSLDMMSRFLSWALLRGVHGSKQGWFGDKPQLIVAVPGYDRHFTLAEALGYELVTVPMTEQGPDVARVAELATSERVKGLFFVPTYSNPTGDCLSESLARQLVGVAAAAPDFTIFADDAYAVHHLEEPVPAPNLLTLAQEAGVPERVILFGSTSKVTFASGGLGLAGMSETNIQFWSAALNTQTIGPNKSEQWRHVCFLREYPGGLRGLMRDHAAILKPKFEAVERILCEALGNQDLASWTHPRGGYFVNLVTHRPVASRVIELARDAGLALTPVGATFPGGKDPKNTTIRLAPTRPPLEEVELAMELVACCVKLAAEEFDAKNSDEKQPATGAEVI